MKRSLTISGQFASSNDMTLRCGDCLRFLKSLPDQSAQLVLTSPPYNVGKEYEHEQTFTEFIDFQRRVIAECVRITKDGGSLCWQVGNHIDDRGAVAPLDIFLHPIFSEHDELYLRNRIVWHYEHGLHCRTRFSGRHDTILWYSKGRDYVFNLDDVRVPQKYPGKLAYKGPARGTPSCNPIGKNPGDVWQIPNVKANHAEKTDHPCQFPIALAETVILALTNRRHLVVDPFLGAATTAIAAMKNGRRAAGAEINPDYVRLIRQRVRLLQRGELPYRPRTRPIYTPPPNSKLTRHPAMTNGASRNGQETG